MTPTQPRLEGLVTVRDERLLWLRGFMTDHPDICLEMSFERVPGTRPLPGTNITYLGIWRRGPRGTLFEFQLGQIFKVPSPDDYKMFVEPIIERLQAYNPPQVV